MGSLRWVIETQVVNAGGDTVRLRDDATYTLTCAAGGGGVLADGDVRLEDSFVVNNQAGGPGGGGGGGGIYAFNIALVRSVVSGNVAFGDGDGGGIQTNAGTVTLFASTVSGIEAHGVVTLVYSTIVGNVADPNTVCPDVGYSGGGAGGFPANLMVDASQLTSFGTVVALPTGGSNCATSGLVPVTGTISNGYNFSDDASCGFTASTDGRMRVTRSWGPSPTTAGRRRRVSPATTVR